MRILDTWDNHKQGSFADDEERGKFNFSEMGIRSSVYDRRIWKVSWIKWMIDYISLSYQRIF